MYPESGVQRNEGEKLMRSVAQHIEANKGDGQISDSFEKRMDFAFQHRTEKIGFPDLPRIIDRGTFDVPAKP
jgi:hypothetical protein